MSSVNYTSNMDFFCQSYSHTSARAPLRELCYPLQGGRRSDTDADGSVRPAPLV
jgi:hypothetical protein